MNVLTQLAHLPTLLVISRFDTISPGKIRTKYAQIHSNGLKTRINPNSFPRNATNAEQSEKPE
jgi:hypothetical protein